MLLIAVSGEPVGNGRTAAPARWAAASAAVYADTRLPANAHGVRVCGAGSPSGAAGTSFRIPAVGDENHPCGPAEGSHARARIAPRHGAPAVSRGYSPQRTAGAAWRRSARPCGALEKTVYLPSYGGNSIGATERKAPIHTPIVSASTRPTHYRIAPQAKRSNALRGVCHLMAHQFHTHARRPRRGDGCTLPVGLEASLPQDHPIARAGGDGVAGVGAASARRASGTLWPQRISTPKIFCAERMTVAFFARTQP